MSCEVTLAWSCSSERPFSFAMPCDRLVDVRVARVQLRLLHHARQQAALDQLLERVGAHLRDLGLGRAGGLHPGFHRPRRVHHLGDQHDVAADLRGDAVDELLGRRRRRSRRGAREASAASRRRRMQILRGPARAPPRLRGGAGENSLGARAEDDAPARLPSRPGMRSTRPKRSQQADGARSRAALAPARSPSRSRCSRSPSRSSCCAARARTRSRSSSQSSRAPWIAAPEPVDGNAPAVGPRGRSRSACSGAASSSTQVPAAARLRVRALRAFRVLVNGEPVPGAASDGSRWRDTSELDAGALARCPARTSSRSRSRIRSARACSRCGSKGPSRRSRAIREWQVSVDGGPAALGRARRRHAAQPAALAVGHAGRGAARALGRGGAALRRGRGGVARAAGASARRACVRARCPAASLALGLAAWAALFARKLVHLPLTIGFDARSPPAYVELLASRRGIPLATDGWSTFHPPLFYALGATLLAGGRAPSSASGSADAEGDRVRERHARPRRHRRARAPPAAGRSRRRARSPSCSPPCFR